MGDKEALHRVERKISRLDSDIAKHPLASGPIAEAQSVIDAYKGQGEERIAECLAERGLPTLQEVGKVTLKSMISWGRLHRRRKKLVDKRERLLSG